MTENDAIIQIKKTKKSISGKSSQKMKWSDEMLTEERLQGIERIVKEKGSASIPELMERMGISESTARRDLTLLDKQGRLQKVRGGAMIIGDVYSTKRRYCTPEKRPKFRGKSGNCKVCGIAD